MTTENTWNLFAYLWYTFSMETDILAEGPVCFFTDARLWSQHEARHDQGPTEDLPQLDLSYLSPVTGPKKFIQSESRNMNWNPETAINPSLGYRNNKKLKIFESCYFENSLNPFKCPIGAISLLSLTQRNYLIS